MEETEIISGPAAVIVNTWPRIVTGLAPAEELKCRAAMAAKIANCYQLVEGVMHDDRNREQHYSFASAETIYRTVRKGLHASGLAVLPFMGDFIEEPIMKKENANERRGSYMVVSFEFVLMDSETGYSLVIPWRGEVMEYGDKAFNKASTNATKYFLRTLFLLPTDRDEDTDSYHEQGRPQVSRQNNGRQGRQNAPQPRAAAPATRNTPEALNQPLTTEEQANMVKPAEPAGTAAVIQTTDEARREAYYLEAYPFAKIEEHPLAQEQRAAFATLREKMAAAGVKFLELCDVLKGERGEDFKLTHAELLIRAEKFLTDSQSQANEQPVEPVAAAPEETAAVAPESPGAPPETPPVDDSKALAESVAEKRKKAASVASQPNGKTTVTRLEKELELFPAKSELLRASLNLGLRIKDVFEEVAKQNPNANLGDVEHRLKVLTEERNG